MTHVEVKFSPGEMVGALFVQEMTVLYIRVSMAQKIWVTRSEGWVYGGPNIVPVLKWTQGGRASTDITEHQREWLSR